MQEFEMANAYIGDPRTPGDDVIAYLRLNQNTQTTSEKGTYTWTWTNLTYDSLWAYFNGTFNCKITANSNFPDMNTATIAFWCKCNPSDMSGIGGNIGWIFFDGTSTSWHDFWFWIYSSWSYSAVSKANGGSGFTSSLWTWDTTKYNCIVISYTSTGVNVYKNGQLLASHSSTTGVNVGYHYTPTIGTLNDWNITDQSYKWRISNFVLSNKWRSLDESTAFYNATKWLYLN